MNTTHELAALRAALARDATPARAAAEKRYLKSPLVFLGATVPKTRAVARAWCKAHPGLSRQSLFPLVDAAWKSGVHELRSVAVLLLAHHEAALAPADLPRLVRMLRDAGTWAHVDWLSTAVVAPIAERAPAAQQALERWSGDPSFWVRRASLLALLPALRRGEGDFPLFERLSTTMLDEKEFFIRKAVGWVLREVSKRRPDLVRGYVARHGDRMAGLTRREAEKHLPRR